MAGSTPEYRTLLRLTVNIQKAVKDQLVSFGAELVSKELISPEQYERIRNTQNPSDSRAADLVGYVQGKVQQNSQHYHTFIKALESDEAQYRDILKKLKETYDSFRLPVDTTSHQPPPAVHKPGPSLNGPPTPPATGATILHDRDHTEIYQKLVPCAAQWRDIGKALGFTEGEMNNIQSTPMLMMQAPGSWLGQMLSQWLQWAPGDGRGSQGFATKESLHAALLQTNLGNDYAQQFL